MPTYLLNTFFSRNIIKYSSQRIMIDAKPKNKAPNWNVETINKLADW